ncbi:MAG: very short patch repair endonuclease [Cellulomonas sp.]
MGPVTVPSWASSDAARRSMQSNRSRDTAPELALRHHLHARRLRYRVAYPPIPSLRRTADIAFTRARVAVFVDGCFWHGCPEHYRAPTLNAEYWAPKVARNQARDTDTTAQLRAAGWTVLRYWEHEDPWTVADMVEAVVRGKADLRRTAQPDRISIRCPGG